MWRKKNFFGHLRDGTKGYSCPIHLEPFLESVCRNFFAMGKGMWTSKGDVQWTAFLSVSHASLACKARGMASRHTFQNLALTHDVWKRMAGRHYRFSQRDALVQRGGIVISYPCPEATNHERAIWTER
jgi:hypothetical protein